MTGLTADGRQLARWAMEAWELVADIEFVEVTSGEMITMDDEESGAFAGYTSRGSTTTKADVNVGTEWLASYGTSIDSYSLQTYIHELGHALGLGHQGAYKGGADYGMHETFSNDSWQLSIMSYFDQSENTRTDASYATLPGPMMADILAIQNLYGASDVTNGATTWGVGSNLPGYLGDFFNDALSNSEYGGGPVAFTIFDNGGVDHINASNSMTDDRWDMREQHFSDVNGLIGNVGIAAGTAIEHLTGGSGNDTITGNDLDNRINSGDGDDTIVGGDDNDTIDSGDDNDSIVGGDGDDSIIGGRGDDTINSDDDNDSLDGGAGFDQARFGAAFGDFDVTKTVTQDGDVYTIVSAKGTDTVRNVEEFVFGDTTLSAAQMDALAETADQTLVGSEGDDTIFGGRGDDTITSGDGNNWIFSGDGDDTIISGDDNDSLDGGAGFDQARFRVAFRDFDVIRSGDVYTIVSAEGTDTVRNVEEFVFGDTTLSAAQMDARAAITARDQLLVGNDDDDAIWGGYGNDTIRAGNGNNRIDTRAGNDLINSGDGHDTILSGADNDTINSGDGNDSLDGGAGTDQARFRVAFRDFAVIKDGDVYTIVSQEGVDTVTNVEEFVFTDTTLSAAQMDRRAGRITADDLLLVGGADNDTIISGDGADTIHGGDGDNTIRSGDGNNRIWSGDGADTITTGSGNDTIISGRGNDTITSGDGNDFIWSGDGADEIRSGDGNNRIWSGDGADTITTGDGNNRIFSGYGFFVDDDDSITTGDGNDAIISGAGNDTIISGRGNDTISSGDDNDSIFSGDDNDTIWSGDGDDTIRSGEGDDSILSGYGNDRIFGDAGADTFVFKRGYDRDEINDFEIGTDTLRLSGALTGGMTGGADIISTYATLTNGAVVFDFGEGDIITISNLASLTGLSADIEIF